MFSWRDKKKERKDKLSRVRDKEKVYLLQHAL